MSHTSHTLSAIYEYFVDKQMVIGTQRALKWTADLFALTPAERQELTARWKAEQQKEGTYAETT
jgi:hypothetical protein